MKKIDYSLGISRIIWFVGLIFWNSKREISVCLEGGKMRGIFFRSPVPEKMRPR